MKSKNMIDTDNKELKLMLHEIGDDEQTPRIVNTVYRKPCQMTLSSFFIIMIIGMLCFARTLEGQNERRTNIEVTFLDTEGNPATGKFSTTSWQPASGSQIQWLESETKRGWRHKTSIATGNSYRFQMEPGQYRISVWSGHGGDPTPMGVSDIIIIDSPDQHESISVQLEGNTPLTLKIRDKDTGQPLGRMYVQLIRFDGIPVGYPSKSFMNQTDDSSEFTWKALVPGKYTIHFRKPFLIFNHEFGKKFYATPDKGISIDVIADKNNVVEIPVEPHTYTEEELEKILPFKVTGTITDGNGKPIEGADLWISYWGTGSQPTAPMSRIKSSKDGTYLLRFERGRIINEERSTVEIPQRVIIGVSKPGYYEENLGRHGYFVLPNENGEPAGDFPQIRIATPDKDLVVNHVMRPAAQVSGVLKDLNGEPIARAAITLHGETGHGKGILKKVITNDNGLFAISEIPARSYQFNLHIGDSIVSSSPHTFREGMTYQAQLYYDKNCNTLSLEINLHESMAKLSRPVYEPTNRTEPEVNIERIKQ